MKKISMISVFIFIMCSLLLCSCGKHAEPIQTQTPSPEPTQASLPEFRSYAEKKDSLLDELCALYGLDKVLFEKLQEGVQAYAGGIADLPETVSPEQIAIAKNMIKNEPEMFFVKDIELAEDGLSVNIFYTEEQIQAEKEKQELISRIDSVIAKTISADYSKFENMLSVYSYLAKNIDSVSDEKLNSYDLFVGGKADSFEFARAMQFLLKQADIKSYVTNSAEGEAWVTAEINNNYYHFSPYLESKKSHGQNLEFFGATDAQMQQYYSFWLVQDGLMEITALDAAFEYTRNITGYGVDFPNEAIYFVDKADDNKIVKCTYFTDAKESVYNKRAADMVYINNKIYFADLDGRNKLCVIDLATGKQEELDSIFVTRMYARGGKLIYFDDVSNTEGSIVIE